jgi:hypothetical protein
LSDSAHDPWIKLLHQPGSQDDGVVCVSYRKDKGKNKNPGWLLISKGQKRVPAAELELGSAEQKSWLSIGTYGQIKNVPPPCEFFLCMEET